MMQEFEQRNGIHLPCGCTTEDPAVVSDLVVPPRRRGAAA
jgi:hypothetical protein